MRDNFYAKKDYKRKSTSILSKVEQEEGKRKKDLFTIL